MVDERPRQRRRGEVLEQAILRAAVAELIESGYPGLAMDRVAQRAGTNKNAIYRRWPSRAALGVAAYHRLAADEQRPPDTGELRADTLTILRRVNDDATSPRARVLSGLMSSIGDEPELQAQLRAQLAGQGLDIWLTVLGRAVARGDIGPAALRPRIATLAMTLLRHEYLTAGFTPVPDETIVEIVDRIYLPLLRAVRD